MSLQFEFIFAVTVCFQGVESLESSKTNADETSNVIETQTSERQENETSREQKMDYQRDSKQMDETAADNSESVGVPQEQQKTEEFDDYVKVSAADIPSKTYLFRSKEALSLNGKQRQHIPRNTT